MSVAPDWKGPGAATLDPKTLTKDVVAPKNDKTVKNDGSVIKNSPETNASESHGQQIKAQTSPPPQKSVWPSVALGALVGAAATVAVQKLKEVL